MNETKLPPGSLSSAVDLAQQFDALLCDVSQLVDGWKNVEPGAWSEWDQSVRDRITCMRGRLVVDVLGNAALTQQRDELLAALLGAIPVADGLSIEVGKFMPSWAHRLQTLAAEMRAAIAKAEKPMTPLPSTAP